MEEEACNTRPELSSQIKGVGSSICDCVFRQGIYLVNVINNILNVKLFLANIFLPTFISREIDRLSSIRSIPGRKASIKRIDFHFSV